jgi:hypothetical protein
MHLVRIVCTDNCQVRVKTGLVKPVGIGLVVFGRLERDSPDFPSDDLSSTTASEVDSILTRFTALKVAQCLWLAIDRGF